MKQTVPHMTRRHFEYLSMLCAAIVARTNELLQEHISEPLRTRLTDEIKGFFVEYLSFTNDRFDRDRFLSAVEDRLT